MPIESNLPSGTAGQSTIGAAFLSECRATLNGALAKIENCLQQLADDDLHWRQHESHNSIENVLLHLCGNLRQWILHGVAGAPDIRNRPQEFADRTRRTKGELLTMIRQIVTESDRALDAFPPERLLEPRKIQGFETTVLAAILDTVSHLVGHQHQIVYITRLRLGDDYKFQWRPATPEQGGPPAMPQGLPILLKNCLFGFSRLQ